MIEQDIISLFNWQNLWDKISNRRARQQTKEGLLTKLSHKKPEPETKPEPEPKSRLEIPDWDKLEFPMGLANQLKSEDIDPVDFARSAIMLGMVVSSNEEVYQLISGEHQRIRLSDIPPCNSDTPSFGSHNSDFSIDSDTYTKLRETSVAGVGLQEWFLRSVSLYRMIDGLDLQYKVWGKAYPFNMEYVRNYFEAHEWPIPEITPMSNHMTLKAESSNRA